MIIGTQTPTTKLEICLAILKKGNHKKHGLATPMLLLTEVIAEMKAEKDNRLKRMIVVPPYPHKLL